MTTIAELDKKIADFEGSLNQPLPEAVLDSLRAKIAELQQERARLAGAGAGVQGMVNTSGTVNGAAIGVNYGTTNNTFYGTPAPAPTRTPTRDEEIAGQHELLARHRGTLSALLRRLAITGSAYAAPDVIFGIREARAGIARARAALDGYGVGTEAHPDDAEH